MENSPRRQLLADMSSGKQISNVLNENETQCLSPSSQVGVDVAAGRNRNDEMIVLRTKKKQIEVELAHKAQLAEYGPVYPRPRVKDDGALIECTLYGPDLVIEEGITIPRIKAPTLDSFISELGHEADSKIEVWNLKINTHFDYMTLYYIAPGIQRRDARFVTKNNEHAYEKWIKFHDRYRSSVYKLLISVHLDMFTAGTLQGGSSFAVEKTSPHSANAPMRPERAFGSEGKAGQVSQVRSLPEGSRSKAVATKRAEGSENQTRAVGKTKRGQNLVDSSGEVEPPLQLPTTGTPYKSSNTQDSGGLQQTLLKERADVQSPSHRKTNNSWEAGMPPAPLLYNREKGPVSKSYLSQILDSMSDAAEVEPERNPKPLQPRSLRPADTMPNRNRESTDLISFSDTDQDQGNPHAKFEVSAKAGKDSSSDKIRPPGRQKRRKDTQDPSHDNKSKSGDTEPNASRNLKRQGAKAPSGSDGSPSKKGKLDEGNDGGDGSETPVVTPSRRKKPSMTSMSKFIGTEPRKTAPPGSYF